MGYEENNPADISESLVLSLLSDIFPEIKKEDISFYYHGTYNIFIVKGEYIFRFPDKSLYNSKGFKLIKNEIKFLKEVRSSLSFEIPRPTYHSKDENNPFVGYKKIPGISLSRVYSETSNNDREKLGRSIGNFLSELHSPELSSKVSEKLFEGKMPSSEDHFVTWSMEYERVKEVVFPRIDESSKKWVNKVFESYLENRDNFQFIPTLVHGDFDTSNILVDPATLEITGIIDFEEARISDPALDLIFIEEGDIFRNSILGNYTGKIDETLEERVKFYFYRGGTAYILYGVENNIPQLAEHGKVMIKHRMNLFSS